MMNKDQIQQKIIEGKLDKAIEMMLAVAEKQNKDLYNDVIMLASRLNSLQKDQRNGIITSEHYQLHENRLRLAIHQTLEDFEYSKEENILQNEENPTIKVLFLASNPKDEQQLRLGQEVREIEEKIQLSRKEVLIQSTNKFAVRLEDLQQAMMEQDWDIVHFSGHGSHQGRIIFENNNGLGLEVPPKALGNLFSLFPSIQCVVLNACYSEAQAQEISKHVPFVIGMNEAIKDEAAITFSSSFYAALSNGKDIKFAFNLAKVSIELMDIAQENLPVMIEK